MFFLAKCIVIDRVQWLSQIIIIIAIGRLTPFLTIRL
jgi:hypothetical protein